MYTFLVFVLLQMTTSWHQFQMQSSILIGCRVVGPKHATADEDGGAAVAKELEEEVIFIVTEGAQIDGDANAEEGGARSRCEKTIFDHTENGNVL